MVSMMRKLQARKDELLICDRTYAELKVSFAQRYKHWCREVKNKGKQAAPAAARRLASGTAAGAARGYEASARARFIYRRS